MDVPNVAEKTGTEILKINSETYGVFESIQKCGYFIGKELYIYGLKIQELLSKTEKYNPWKIIEIIVVNNSFDGLEESVNSFFSKNRKIGMKNDKIIFKTPKNCLIFYLVPNFSANKINDEFGFTIDQIYYNIKLNKVYDTTGTGLLHFLSSPKIIKSTVKYEKWSESIITNFFIKLGTYYDSKISSDDYNCLKNVSVSNFKNLNFIFETNRPGTVIKELIELYPAIKNNIFDTLLRLSSTLRIIINENIHPKKVFSEEKLKLLDLYGDYFNSSKNLSEKAKKVETLVKVLADIQ